MIEEIFLDEGLVDVIKNYNTDKDLEVNLRKVDKILENKGIEADVNIITEVYNTNTTKAPDIGMLEFLKLTSALTGIPLREYLKNYCKSNTEDIDMSLFEMDDQDEIKSILLEVNTNTHTGKLEIDVEEVEELDLSSLSIEDIEEAIEETLINLDLDENEDPPETIEVQFKKFGNRKFTYRIETSPSFVELPQVNSGEENLDNPPTLENIHQIIVTGTGKVIDDIDNSNEVQSIEEDKSDTEISIDSIEQVMNDLSVEQIEETHFEPEQYAQEEITENPIEEMHIEEITEEHIEEIEYVPEEYPTDQFEEVEFTSEEMNESQNIPEENIKNIENIENIDEIIFKPNEDDCIEPTPQDRKEMDDILSKVVTSSLNDLNDKFKCEDLKSKDITSIPVDGYVGDIYNLED